MGNKRLNLCKGQKGFFFQEKKSLQAQAEERREKGTKRGCADAVTGWLVCVHIESERDQALELELELA